MAASRFPWDEFAAAGLAILHVGPDALWRMTPGEIASALRGLGSISGAASDPMSRREFDALAERFPD